MREYYIHPDVVTHGFAWLSSWPHWSIRSLNGLKTDSTHKSHTPLQVNLRHGYIYIPTDIIWENSSLKKFTVWQIRLNYLQAKTNRPLSKLHPPACMDWFYLDRASIFHIFKFYVRNALHHFHVVCKPWHWINSGQHSGINKFRSLLLQFSDACFDLWCFAIKCFAELIHWSGKFSLYHLAWWRHFDKQSPAAGYAFFSVACKVSKSCKVQCTHLISWLSNRPIRTWFSSVPLQDKSISHKPQDI